MRSGAWWVRFHLALQNDRSCASECVLHSDDGAAVSVAEEHAGAPTPIAASEASGVLLGAQAEAEMAFGDNLKLSVSSRDLSEAKISMTYKLGPGVRAHLGYTAPRKAYMLVLDIGEKSGGFDPMSYRR